MSGWQAGQAVTWVRHVVLGVQGGVTCLSGALPVGVVRVGLGWAYGAVLWGLP